MRHYTDSQQEVINYTGSNLLVSASAGSGKTEVTMQKIYELIVSKKVDIDQLLVVTFTSAAANEMKSRLLSKLQQGEINSRILNQIDGVSTADISTLHSFCQKMIKQYFYAIGIDPSFELISEEDRDMLRLESIDKLLIEHQDNDKLSEILQIFKARKDTIMFKRTIMELYDFLQSIEDGDYLQSTALSSYNLDLNGNKTIAYLNDYIIRKLMFYRDQFSYYLQSSSSIECAKLSAFCSAVLDKFDCLTEHNTFEQTYAQILALKTMPSFPTGKFDQSHIALKQSLQALWNGFKKTKTKLLDIFDCDMDEALARMSKTKSQLETIVWFVKEFDREYSHNKHIRNLLDFNDLEQFMIRLLKKKDLCEKISSRYKYIFVDEYQDINAVQEKIISLLSNNNVTMVGDVKQSIYGFRNSNPDIFLNKYNDYQKNKSANKAISLNDNFRCYPSILEFVNKVCDVVMTKYTSGVDYKNDARFVINKGAPIEQTHQVEIDIIKPFDKSVNETPSALYRIEDTQDNEDYSAARLEAKIVANKIKELLDKEVYNVSDKCYKKIDYSSIAILSRNRKDYYRTFVEELNKYNIPILANFSDFLYQNIDIMLLVSFLKVVAKSEDDISYITILCSPFVGVTYDELAILRQSCGKPTIMECAMEYCESHKDDLASKIKSLNKTIEKYTIRATCDTVLSLLYSIIDEWGIYNYLLALPSGEKRIALIDKYLDTIKGADYNTCLTRYLYFVDNYAQDAKFDMSIIGNENSVTVSTIHGSKGLGYDVVFLIGAGENFVGNAFGSNIEKDKDYGLGMDCYDIIENTKDSTLPKEAIKIIKSNNDFAEEMRILYVALTRAKSRLIIVGQTDIAKLDPITNELQVFDNKDYISLIINALGEDLVSRLSNGEKVIANDGYLINVVDNDEVSSSEEELTVELPDKIDTKGLEIEGYLDRAYDYNTDITIKNSVTSLMEENRIYENVNSMPKDFGLKESKSLSSSAGAQLGTAYHTAMQEIPLDADIEQICKYLHDKSKSAFNGEYFAQINPSKIKKAIDCISALGGDVIMKEKSFLAYLPYNEVVGKGEQEDKILLQGVIDFVSLGKKNIIVDYKTTKVNSEQDLRDKYALQLHIYKLATQKALCKTIDEVYVYSFYLDKMIKI